MSETAPAAVDRGDLKSTTYEFFMLAMACIDDHHTEPSVHDHPGELR